MKNYNLTYLPLFYEDLESKILYIARELQNPYAANNLLTKIEAAIQKRLPFAESYEKYASLCEREYPYYRIYVENFIIYYVVIGNNMEIRRLLYKHENRDTKI